MTEWRDANALRGLAEENTAAITALRRAHIPQRVGMAAACRVLAEELPRVLTQQLEADLASGQLAERWALAKAAAVARGGHDDPMLMAAVALLRQHHRALVRTLRLRGQEWAAAAHRLEGQADALEAQNERLAHVAANAAGANDSPGSCAPPLLGAGDAVAAARAEEEP